MPVSPASVEICPFASIGAASHGWLNAYHHFSFAGYHAPDRMHWGQIRVWNDDEIAAQSGFPPHPHDNMEIITYVREGAITHRDSMGNQGRTDAGNVQVMSAGTGVVHSEYNLENGPCRLFQIWVMPRERNIAPRWEQRAFPKSDRSGKFTCLASGMGDEGALTINADARLFCATLKAGDEIYHEIDDGRCAYLVAVNGAIETNGQPSGPRDGVAIGTGQIIIRAKEDTELVMVDSI